MWDMNINLVICVDPDDYHNLETKLFCKPWHFPVFALLHIVATCFLPYIKCNGIP